ncbi:hypothetical protein ACVIGB_001146 [Bradyrhizobium sp. USDA 4341]
MKPEFITFTGADDETSVAGMRDLSASYPIEWGILFSPQRQGNEPRYPSQAAIARFEVSGLRLAAHLCGGHAVRIMDLVTPNVPADLALFSRIQVNHSNPDPERIAEFSARCGKRCIAQSRSLEFSKDDRVDWLFDASGGRGVSPLFWPKHPGRPVGYAGGLGPDNVVAALEAIGAEGSYWVDMESRVREGDRFGLNLVEKVCVAVYGAR